MNTLMLLMYLGYRYSKKPQLHFQFFSIYQWSHSVKLFLKSNHSKTENENEWKQTAASSCPEKKSKVCTKLYGRLFYRRQMFCQSVHVTLSARKHECIISQRNQSKVLDYDQWTSLWSDSSPSLHKLPPWCHSTGEGLLYFSLPLCDLLRHSVTH